MKHFLLLSASVILLSCSSQKNVPSSINPDSTTVETTGSGETKAATPTKTIILNNTEAAEPTPATKAPNPGREQATSDNLPACLQTLVKQFLAEDVQNPPRKIYSYKYDGKLVYYVTPPCCDFFSDLYDSQCKIIAHPDGGITGKGDGRAKNFNTTKTEEKLVWEDVRRN